MKKAPTYLKKYTMLVNLLAVYIDFEVSMKISKYNTQSEEVAVTINIIFIQKGTGIEKQILIESNYTLQKINSAIEYVSNILKSSKSIYFDNLK